MKTDRWKQMSWGNLDHTRNILDLINMHKPLHLTTEITFFGRAHIFTKIDHVSIKPISSIPKTETFRVCLPTKMKLEINL